jgi:hypothetical protein
MTDLEAALEYESKLVCVCKLCTDIHILARAVRDLQARVKALEQAIEDAPHGPYCNSGMVGGGNAERFCNCWKDHTKEGA